MWGVRITIVDSKNFNETRIRHHRDLSKDIDFILLFNGIREKGHYSSIRRSDRVLNEVRMLKRTRGYDVEKDCRERIMRNDAEWDKVVERENWSIVRNGKLASYKSKGKVVSKIEKIIKKRKVHGDSDEAEEREKAPTPVKQVEPDIQEVNIGDKRCVKCCIDFENTAKLQRHVTVFHLHAHRFRCTSCNKGYDTKEGLQKHNNYRHKEKEKRFECEVCGSKFQEKKSLTQHIKVQHPGPDAEQFKCKGCGKTWLIKKNWKAHEAGCEKNKDRKAKICPICGVKSGYTIPNTKTAFRVVMGQHISSILVAYCS